jgi:hypothetical protein
VFVQDDDDASLFDVNGAWADRGGDEGVDVAFDCLHKFFSVSSRWRRLGFIF